MTRPYADTVPLRPRSRRRRAGVALVAGTLTSLLAGCTLAGDDGQEQQQNQPENAGQTSETAPKMGEVVLVTHESFTLPDEVIAGFAEETGYELVLQASGDAGSLTNQLVLTQGSPIGDAVFGIDNTYASRAVQEGVLSPYSPADLPDEVTAHALPGDGADQLTPVTYGDVCVNIDDTWFEAEGIEPPQTLQDLTDPTYEGLFVTPGASSSSPGLAFLVATVGEFGADGWQDYWRDLMANGAVVTSGWSDAYGVDFTFSGGDRPIVLSYASSPPFTIPEDEADDGGEPTTSALLETCFRQVEYAGVLEGAANPEGAQALVDYLLTEDVQAAIPDAMFVYPVVDVELPEVWAQWADVAEAPIEVDPAEIEANREDWVREWADIATG